jgi:hypothetical protein
VIDYAKKVHKPPLWVRLEVGCTHISVHSLVFIIKTVKFCVSVKVCVNTILLPITRNNVKAVHWEFDDKTARCFMM